MTTIRTIDLSRAEVALYLCPFVPSCCMTTCVEFAVESGQGIEGQIFASDGTIYAPFSWHSICPLTLFISLSILLLFEDYRLLRDTISVTPFWDAYGSHFNGDPDRRFQLVFKEA